MSDASAPSLLPPSASATAHAFDAAAAARLGAVPIAVDRLPFPDACPSALLPWLAWGFSVDSWDAAWSEGQKRKVIAASIAVHRRKGTRAAVTRALGALTLPIELSEWFEHGGHPHSFGLTLNAPDALAAGFKLEARFYDRIFNLVDAVKPVRSHYELRLDDRFESTPRLGHGVGLSRIDRKTPDATPRPHKAASLARFSHGVDLARIDFKTPVPAPRAHRAASIAYWRQAPRLARISHWTHNVTRRAA